MLVKGPAEDLAPNGNIMLAGKMLTSFQVEIVIFTVLMQPTFNKFFLGLWITGVLFPPKVKHKVESHQYVFDVFVILFSAN